MSKLIAVSEAATVTENEAAAQHVSEEFPGIDHPPAGESFDDVPAPGGVRRPGAGRGAGCTSSHRVLLLSEQDDELSWQERALCAQTDPEAFFPEKGGSTREAKKVCVSCEVRAECLEYALAHDERFGIWGGLSERERRRLKKQAG